MENQDETLKQINRSGFPFQLGIEQQIRTTEPQHGWTVASREHPWRNPDSEASGFIDLVLSHTEMRGDRLVIECKRVKGEDRRQLQWLFLLPDQELKQQKRASCREVLAGEMSKSSESKGWMDHRLWDDVQVIPPSPESEFCILSGDEAKKQPILEALCGDVLESVEGLAQEEVSIQKSQPTGRLLRFIFPAIVTNAKIAVCQFKSSDVSLADGTLDLSNVKLDTVPFIRFRKSLATTFPEGTFFHLKEAHRARERTVFIINAEGLPDFLKDFRMKEPPLGFAIQRYADKYN
jgi:hypothetical protein